MIVVIASLLIINLIIFSMKVLFQALTMYMNCFNAPMHPFKHMQFVNNVLMYIVLL